MNERDHIWDLKVEPANPEPPPPDGKEELRDFLGNVAGWGLAARLRRRVVTFVLLPAARTRGWIVTIAMVLVGVWIATHVAAAKPVTKLPRATWGAWGTTDAKYSDRQFWISEQAVAFQTGTRKRDVRVHRIVAVRIAAQRADTTVYAIEYEEGGGTKEWSIAFTPAPHRGIRFQNQRSMLWQPAAGPAWPSR